ncbi:MAG: hypothetical protein QM691_14050 [Opitutaceae bacterium]
MLVAALTAAALPAEPIRCATTQAPAASQPAVQDPDEKVAVTAEAPDLIRKFLASRYSAAGERLEVALTLQAPESVPGWPGRWRFNGTATLRHFRSEADEVTRRRVLEIRENHGLSAGQKIELIEDTTFIRSETIAFEACVTRTGADASLDFTLR